MSIGALRKNLALQAESVVSDGSGGITTGWTTLATVWGQVEPVTAPIHVGTEGRTTHKITLRWRSDITVTTGMRLVMGSRIFTIRAVINTDEANRWWELQTEEGGTL